MTEVYLLFTDVVSKLAIQLGQRFRLKKGDIRPGRGGYPPLLEPGKKRWPLVAEKEGPGGEGSAGTLSALLPAEQAKGGGHSPQVWQACCLLLWATKWALISNSLVAVRGRTRVDTQLEWGRQGDGPSCLLQDSLIHLKAMPA